MEGGGCHCSCTSTHIWWQKDDDVARLKLRKHFGWRWSFGVWWASGDDWWLLHPTYHSHLDSEKENKTKEKWEIKLGRKGNSFWAGTTNQLSCLHSDRGDGVQSWSTLEEDWRPRVDPDSHLLLPYILGAGQCTAEWYFVRSSFCKDLMRWVNIVCNLMRMCS